MRAVHALGHALSISAGMTWEILWALLLGFALSSVVSAVVCRSTIVRVLGDDRPRTFAIATGFGAVSSSCSYAAVALARSLFRKGASFTAAMAFEIASTNLVVELGIILALLIGWQFTLAEFIGGPLMIILLALVFRLFLRQRLLDAAKAQADKGLAGSMEGHAAMDMTIGGEGSMWDRLRSKQAATSGISHLRHGVGGSHPRHRPRPSHRRRSSSVGTEQLLAAPLLRRPPHAGRDLGSADRPDCQPSQLRLLDRQRAPRRGPVEGRHELRGGRSSSPT